MENRSRPYTQGERYDLIDALRGFTLLGVCLANLSPLSLYEFLGPDEQAALPSSGFDVIARYVIEELVNIKFITIFSAPWSGFRGEVSKFLQPHARK